MTSDRQDEASSRILAVEGAGKQTNLPGYLISRGFEVETAASERQMNAAVARQAFDLVLLDLPGPGDNGLSACRRLAEAGGPAVIILSEMAAEADRIIGLELGADDYIPKPYSQRELLARIRAVLRGRAGRLRQPSRAWSECQFLGYSFSPSSGQVRAPSGMMISLTRGEFLLLNVFLNHAGELLSRDQLVSWARGPETEVFDRVVDVQVSRLRRKLNECDGHELIRTQRGGGYLFNASIVRR